jgi:predicted RNA binding protein YcfA (HicA-like mRNA interferase family)
MNSMSGKELAKLLEQNDWILLRIQGSHHIYGKPGLVYRISVPIHGKKDLKIGLLRNLLKKAGLLENILSSEELVAETTDNPLNVDDAEQV